MGQLNLKKDGVLAEGGGRRRRIRIGTRGYIGRKGFYLFLLFYLFIEDKKQSVWLGGIDGGHWEK